MEHIFVNTAAIIGGAAHLPNTTVFIKMAMNRFLNMMTIALIFHTFFPQT